jgi:hypothetical protein
VRIRVSMLAILDEAERKFNADTGRDKQKGQVPHPLAEQVGAAHRQQDRHARERGDPPVAEDELPPLAEHGPPLGGRRLRAHPEEAEVGGENDDLLPSDSMTLFQGCVTNVECAYRFSTAVDGPGFRIARGSRGAKRLVTVDKTTI